MTKLMKGFFRPGLERMEDRITPVTYDWRGGTSSDWGTASNWVLTGTSTLAGAAPTSSIIVHFDTTSTSITAIVDASTDTCAAINSDAAYGGAVRIASGGTLTVDGGTSTWNGTGVIEMTNANAILHLKGGDTYFNAGSINGSGVLNSALGTVYFSNSNWTRFNSGFGSYGSKLEIGNVPANTQSDVGKVTFGTALTGNVTVTNDAPIAVYGNGYLYLDSPNDLVNSDSDRPTLTNYGSVYRDNATSSMMNCQYGYVSNSYINGAFGTLFLGSSTHLSFDATGGSDITCNGGTGSTVIAMKQGAELQCGSSGTGTILVNGGILDASDGNADIGGNLTIDGQYRTAVLNMQSGMMALDTYSDLYISGDLTLLTGSVFKVDIDKSHLSRCDTVYTHGLGLDSSGTVLDTALLGMSTMTGTHHHKIVIATVSASTLHTDDLVSPWAQGVVSPSTWDLEVQATI